MDNTELIAGIAGFCTTTSFIPQVLQTYKTKKTDDISLGMFSLSTFGMSLWMMYGISVQSTSIIVANAISVLFAAYILTIKVKNTFFSKKPNP